MDYPTKKNNTPNTTPAFGPVKQPTLIIKLEEQYKVPKVDNKLPQLSDIEDYISEKLRELSL